MTSAPHIKLALERRFGGRSWVSSTEIEIAYDRPHPAGWWERYIRRFDFVAANVAAGKSFTVVGVEIKVSRQDFLNEQRDSLKFETLRRMSHVAYYATSRGLLKKEELPAGAGLLELQNDGRLKETVKPTRDDRADVTLVLSGLLRRSYVASLQTTLAAIRDELKLPATLSVAGFQDADKWIRQIQRKLKNK